MIDTRVRIATVLLTALTLGSVAARAGEHVSHHGASATAARPSESRAPVDTADARALFERLKTLSGGWKARSTRGWEATTRIRTIASGSAIMMTSFDAHPNETMVTMFTLDQGRLLLTHYCVAGNQPRLLATAADVGRGEVEFTFLDGGNLPTRDRGHMDRAVYRIADQNRFSSRWTWYQNGKERWFEEIEEERVADD
jgi:hypothetical protein